MAERVGFEPTMSF